MKVLASLGIKEKEYRVIKNLYWPQKTCVGEEETEWQEIRRKVRQGFVLPPGLFLLFGEFIMINIEEYEGI